MIDDGKSVLSPSWAFLHPDLLRLIYKKLYDAFDFIHFRAVCKLWRAAAPISDHPPQFPFFLFREKGTYSSEFKLSSYTGKTHTLQVPEACQKEYSGQSQGYLITYRYRHGDDSTNAFLLNPFTRAQRQLPFRGCSFVEILHVSGDPIRNAGDLIMHMNCSCSYQWKTVRLSGNQCEECNVGYRLCYPTTYYKGMLFYSDYRFRKHVIIDMTTGEKSEIKFPGTNNGWIYLVEGPGTLFGIQKHSDIRRASLDRCLFDVYRLDENEKPPRWVKQSNIGDLMIFLNYADGGFCLSASDFNGFKGNCIYFCTDWYATNHLSIQRYYLRKEKSEVIGEVKSNGCWFVPNVY